jgi:hypothetical protein
MKEQPPEQLRLLWPQASLARRTSSAANSVTRHVKANMECRGDGGNPDEGTLRRGEVDRDLAGFARADKVSK